MSLLLYPGWRCFVIIQYIDEAKAASKRAERNQRNKKRIRKKNKIAGMDWNALRLVES